MSLTCSQCEGPLAPGARFCGRCGAPRPEVVEDPAAVERYRQVAASFAKDGALEAHELQQLEMLRQKLNISAETHERIVASLTPSAPARLRLFHDAATIRFFEANTRCMLRLQVANDGDLALETVHVYAEIFGEPALPRVEGPPVFPGRTEVVPLWLVPRMAGFHELRGTVHACDLAGERRFYRFEGLQFRVGSPGEGARISVVNIDQSNARVVDNSRSQFAAAAEAKGGLVGEGEWLPVALRPISGTEAASFVPELAPYAEAEKCRPTATSGPRRDSSGRVHFTVATDRARYRVDAILGQGELSTVYAGVRETDGTPVAVKVADDPADNDLLENEVRSLRLLRSKESPQLKHLPELFDTFVTGDGRHGTVLEKLDGLDLNAIRQRLPEGVPARHMVWLMRRCLSVLGQAHSQGVIHGNVDPAHVIVRAKDHNVWLVDWTASIANPALTGQGFRVLNELYSPPEVAEKKAPLPSADLYALGKTMIYAAGGDPETKSLPESMPEPLAKFILFCVVESPLGRAQDAWVLYRQLDRIREQVYGPHRFEEFVV